MSSDMDLEMIKRRKLLELQRRLSAKRAEASQSIHPTHDPEKVLAKVLIGRAWEVFDAAKHQYPSIMERLAEEIARLVEAGQIRGPITGEQLFWFLRRIGLNVRLETHIRVLESGELKSLADKLRGS